MDPVVHGQEGCFAVVALGYLLDFDLMKLNQRTAQRRRPRAGHVEFDISLLGSTENPAAGSISIGCLIVLSAYK